MDRKIFLGNVVALIAGSLVARNTSAQPMEDETYKRPPYLKPGDVIGICSPAGYITAEEIKPAIQLMKEWGYRIKIGSSVGKRDFTRGGTESDRTADLQQMLDDPNIKAIMCARGGYGAIGIIDRLSWTNFITKPKWVIGFSDITILHNHIHRNCQVASLHSKMCNSFPDDWSKAEPIQVQTINSIRDALSGRHMEYTAITNLKNRIGMADGILVGGNLKTIETLSGTASDINTTGKILFVEDTFEYLYSIDRMFWNLKRTGKLEGLKGLIVGGFNAKPDDPGEEFGRTLEEIVLEKVKDHSYPVCFDFPVGHQRANFALKCGVLHRLSVSKDKAILTELSA